MINNFKFATELGAEIIKVKAKNETRAIIKECEERKITTVCIGKPHINLFSIILATDTFNALLNSLSQENIDLVILS